MSATMGQQAISMDGARRIIDAGDAVGVAAHCTTDAVHHFPPDMYDGPHDRLGVDRGHRAVRSHHGHRIRRVDAFQDVPADRTERRRVVPLRSRSSVARPSDGSGSRPSHSSLLAQIRAYYASPQYRTRDRLELGGFGYAARGHPMEPPFERSRG